MLTKIRLAAMELGCSPDHVRRMVKGGQSPHYRLGSRALRVDPEEIKALGRRIAQGEKGQAKNE